MSILKKIAFILYPIGVAILLPFLLSRDIKAGQVRKTSITEEKPASVTLSFGHTTVISFPTKPEKAVPGAPNRIQVDFLNKDILVTPLAREPGNLIVYDKTSRYVILFRLGTSSIYDDVVQVVPSGSSSRSLRGIRLTEESYTVEKFHIQFKAKQKKMEGTSQEVPVSFEASGKRISGEELFDAIQGFKPIRCPECTVRFEKQIATIACVHPIHSLSCRAENGTLTIERAGEL